MKKLLYVSGLILISMLAGGCGDKTDTAKNSIVEYAGIPYTGEFSENLFENGTLEGEGTFTFTDIDGGVNTIAGKWKSGTLEGAVKIQLADDSVIETDYKKGAASGKAVRTFSDGTSMQYRYADGEPTGKIVYFDQTGKITGLDRFYKDRPAAELCGATKELDWQELLENPGGTYQQMIKAEGTVTDIFGNESRTYVAVKDRNDHTYICEYGNGQTRSPQAVIPNLAVGETVTVYGVVGKPAVLSFSSNYRVINYPQLEEEFSVEEFETANKENASYHAVANEDLTNRLPVIEGFFAENEQLKEIDYGKFDNENAVNYDYEVLADNPYLVSSFALKDTAEVIWSETDKKEKTLTMLLQKQDSGEIYYTEYEFKKEETLPETGEVITFEGALQGCEKLQQIVGFGETKERVLVTVPRVVLENIE